MNETRATTRLRRAARAIILADDDRVLLCRFSFPHPAAPTSATVVWAAPGGGIEPGELPLAALRRELHEETGIVVDVDPPRVDQDLVRGYWSLRSLTAIRWLVEHGFDPFLPGCEVDVLRTQG